MKKFTVADIKKVQDRLAGHRGTAYVGSNFMDKAVHLPGASFGNVVVDDSGMKRTIHWKEITLIESGDRNSKVQFTK